MATPVVADWVPNATNEGATAGATDTTTTWVATPMLLLAVKVNVCSPASLVGGR